MNLSFADNNLFDAVTNCILDLKCDQQMALVTCDSYDYPIISTPNISRSCFMGFIYINNGLNDSEIRHDIY